MLLTLLLSATAGSWAGDVHGAQYAFEGAADPFAASVEVVRFSFESEHEDRDFDGQPDDWIRRKGPGFPQYVSVEIDRQRGRHERQSLRFDANGGLAALYSPPVPLDPLHAYVVRGAVRTQGLLHDGALVSVSFLNHRRQRVQRFLSRPVSGTHADWIELRLGPLLPDSTVRFIVIGCHLVHGENRDLDGTAWFDDLRVGKLPRLSLVSNFETNFVRRSSPIRLEARAGGLDPPPIGSAAGAPPSDYELILELRDSNGLIVEQESFPLPPDEPVDIETLAEAAIEPRSIVWTLPPQEYGFYRARAALQQGGQVLITEDTTFAVIDLAEPIPVGEFGWTVATHDEHTPLTGLADVAAQAGINWLKFPLWRAATDNDAARLAEEFQMFEQFLLKSITPVGLLDAPPPDVRSKFADNWTGVSEVFTLPPAFWTKSLDPVIARYSSSVRHWQLGGDGDASFVEMSAPGETLRRVKQQFDRIGRDTRVGVPWQTGQLPADGAGLRQAFLSLLGGTSATVESLRPAIEQLAPTGAARWIVIKPLPRSGVPPAERSSDLVKQLVAARIAGADAIFAWDVFDPEHGLLNRDGSPTLLYLPWRTTAQALRDTEYLGSLVLPGGSENHVFVRRGEAVLVVWNAEAVAERLYLGEPRSVEAIDVWGVRRGVPVAIDEGLAVQVLDVGPTPLVIRGCSEAVCRWRMAVAFEKGRLPSATGEHPETMLGRNTFPQDVAGEVTFGVPDEWQVTPRASKFSLAAGDELRVPIRISLPPNATLGDARTVIEFTIDADRPYRFRVYRPYQVGLGDVHVEVIDRPRPDGSLEIEQVIVNNTSPEEVLNLECDLFVPGRKRQKKTVTQLGRGTSRKLYIVPGAAGLHGRELWIRVEQIDGRRVLNKRWTVGRDWQPQ